MLSLTQPITLEQQRVILRQELTDCRALTLRLFNQLEQSFLCRQAHADFSPIGWHLGHIAMTESMWLLEKLAGQQDSHPQWRRLLLADGLPKCDRVKLPPLAELLDYLNSVRERTFEYLERAPLGRDVRLWYFILQHECQHAETATLVSELLRLPDTSHQPIASPYDVDLTDVRVTEMVEIPAGDYRFGCDEGLALDNERSPHHRWVDSFWMDRHPVTQEQFGLFMAAGGYENSDFWSEAGWKWQQEQRRSQPRYWQAEAGSKQWPVCGMSYFEAEAYATSVGKRLPTEWEWEKAAALSGVPHAELDFNHAHQVGHPSVVGTYGDSGNAYGLQEMLGNVWEWTSSWFDGYPQFEAFPYRGYSETYFDRQHRVLKGGSWATYSAALRPSFRNWYYPWMREIFAGFRCVSDRPVN